jgi:hypothetical protein
MWESYVSLSYRDIPQKEDGKLSEFQRLSVNINEEAADILRTVTKERGISTTEAVRRAIGLLGFFEEARRNLTKVYTEDQDGNRSKVQIV